jgi:hypothetical protein
VFSCSRSTTKNVCEVCRAACMRGNGKRLPCARTYDFEKSNSVFSSTPAAKVSLSPLSTGHSTRGMTKIYLISLLNTAVGIDLGLINMR